MQCFPNAQIQTVRENRMRDAARKETLPGDRLEWMERFLRLSRTWFAGALQTQRISVRKPGMAGRHAG